MPEDPSETACSDTLSKIKAMNKRVKYSAGIIEISQTTPPNFGDCDIVVDVCNLLYSFKILQVYSSNIDLCL